MECTCGGKIKRYFNYNWFDNPRGEVYVSPKIVCLFCGKGFTWREYQGMRCDKLVEMMRKEYSKGGEDE